MPPRKWDKDKVILAILARKENGMSLSSYSVRKDDNSLWRAAYRRYGSWYKALATAGILPDEHMPRKPRGYWTGERILSEIRKLKENGSSLARADVDKVNPSLTYLASKRFGGWYKAIEAAGINPTSYMVEKPKGYWTDEKIKNEIVQLQKDAGSLEYRIVRERSPALLAAAENRCGGWFNAVKAAGFDRYDYSDYQRWSKERVLSEIKELNARGEDLSAGYCSFKRTKLMNAAIKRFDSWENAIHAAGISYDALRRQHKEYSKQDILKEFARLQEQGIPLNWNSIRSYDASFANAARRKFGSYKAAITAFGLDYKKVNLDRLADRKEWSREMIVEELREYYRRFGSFDLLGKNYPQLSVIVRQYFSSRREAIESAGFDYDTSFRRMKWTKERIIARIREFHDKGEDLSTVNIKKVHGSLLTVASEPMYFGSWENAIQAAGLDYDEIDRYRLANRNVWTDARIIQEIRELDEKKEDLSQVNIEGRFSALLAAAQKHFGNWENALKAAGFDYDKIRRDRHQESRMGRLFEEYLKEMFRVLNWKVKYHKKFEFEDESCVPDFYDPDTGHWIDAKIESYGARVEPSIIKYRRHTKGVIIIYLKGKKRSWKDDSVKFIPVRKYYPDLIAGNAIELKDRFEQLRRGISPKKQVNTLEKSMPRVL